MSIWLRSGCLVFLGIAAAPASAQLAQYGYVAGNLEPEKSFLEKLDEPNKGKYLHYHIYLKTAANVEYEAVIDINDVSPSKPLIYRLASLDGQTDADLATNFGPVFASTNDYHAIVDTYAGLAPNDAQKKAAGALDYLRHPGLMKALQNLPWQNTYAQTTSDPLQWALPQLDALFKPSTAPFQLPGYTKVYVFGAPYTDGKKGMHVVHQNQADIVASYANSNGTWQDGAVIIERHTYLLTHWAVSRKVLMTKFANQTDFTAETNQLSHPPLPGHTLAPTTQLQSVGLIEGDYQDFGPFYATQIQVSSGNTVGSPYGPNSAPKMEVHLKAGTFTDFNDPGDYSGLDQTTDVTPAGRAFVRGYAPISVFNFPIGTPPHPVPIMLRRAWYLRVHLIDPGSYLDSAANSQLTISYY